MIHKKVSFNGEVYWLHGSDDIFHYNLSPLDHYKENGELEANPFSDISYAIVVGDEILRFGDVIGHFKDLVEVKSE